jgi:hypothetical protein
MATIAPAHFENTTADRFFRTLAIAMALTIVGGFSLHFAMGRSTFAARPLVHLHGLAFMGWVALFVTQASLATSGSMALHRRLGWIGAGWAGLLVVMGLLISVDVTQRGTAPFFFRPQFFLIANPMGLLSFVILTASAIRLRRESDWHKRLHICGMTAIIGPAFGRLLPMPLLGQYAFEIAVLAGLVFPAVGMIRDARRDGRVHPAWLLGTVAIISMLPLSHLITWSPIGDAIYAAVTSGHPGANVPGLEFAPPPPGAI